MQRSSHRIEQRFAYQRLVGTADNDLDVVVVAGLRAQPEIDCPSTRDRPPDTEVVHRCGNGIQVEHAAHPGRRAQTPVTMCPEPAAV